MNESKFTLIDKIILGLTITSIVANLLLLIFIPKIMNSLSTFLFQLLTMILGIYIAFRITTISVMNKTIELQKNTAKTAIRHIRGYQWNVETLVEIIKKKISDSSNNKIKESLIEINHHLASLSMGIGLSENDFKDILGEEFKEEHLLITKLNNNIDLLNKKVKEVKNLSKKKEQADRERIDGLNEEIQDLRNKISSNITSLPIGSSLFTPEQDLISIGPSGGLFDAGKSYLTKGFQVKRGFLGDISLEPIQTIDTEIKKKENQNNEKPLEKNKRKTKKNSVSKIPHYNSGISLREFCYFRLSQKTGELNYYEMQFFLIYFLTQRKRHKPQG